MQIAPLTSSPLGYHAPLAVGARPPAPEGPVAASPATLTALHLIDRYAAAVTPVIFVGETGTGKSYFARLLHARSGRRGPFEDVTAGELMGSLARDDLMGHERGAFTGAVGRRLGLIAQASDGTLMIDDFHLLRRSVQYLLLRLFDRGVYRRGGSDRDLPMQCRLVVGIGADPDELVARGRLLKDLRYRLKHCIVRIARLEERREEIAAFGAHFLGRAPEATRVAGGPTRFAPEVLAVLELAPWVGNVRDLEGVIEAAYLQARGDGDDVVRLRHLPDGPWLGSVYDPRASLATKLRLVAWALWRTKGNGRAAARLIGASASTVCALRAAVLERGTQGGRATSSH